MSVVAFARMFDEHFELAFRYSLSPQMGVWHFHFKDFCLFVFNILIFL
jgi:hypothetical protein